MSKSLASRWSMGALVAIALLSGPTHGSQIFTATLTGNQETPPNTSPGTGFGMIVLNDAQTMITVDESWSNLTVPATVSHIHEPAPPGVSAPIVFPFTGVPSAISGSIPEQSFAITPTQVAALEAGLFYFNVHDANFPAGEIRGQVSAAVPEPTSLLLGATAALAGLGWWGYRRRAR